MRWRAWPELRPVLPEPEFVQLWKLRHGCKLYGDIAKCSTKCSSSIHSTKSSISYPKILGMRLRSVKIKNKDNAFASTSKCKIPLKFSLNFEFSLDAGAGNFLPEVKKLEFAQKLRHSRPCSIRHIFAFSISAS